MATTSLSIIACPGKPHSFLAKTAATVSHTGDFTSLSVMAVPGKRHSFVAKTAADGAGVHTGDFTRLSVMALPGQIQSFLAKTEEEDEDYGTAGRWRPRRNKKLEMLNREDNEILEIIISSVITGSIN